MTDKSALKASQPVAWQVLSNALKNDSCSHAYLLYGPKGSAKNQLALLFAQSLFCENRDEDGFACQECEKCRQIEREENPDFFWMHPAGFRTKPMTRKELAAFWSGEAPRQEDEKEQKEYRIRKDDIQTMQKTFSTSALQSGHQVFLLEQYERATVQASNSLLKFLEEPKEGVVGILCTDSLNQVLPTITSRCQLIRLRPSSRDLLEEDLKKLVDDEEMAAMMARAGYTPQELSALMEKENLFEIKDASREYFDNCQSFSALTKLQTGLFQSSRKKGKTISKDSLKLFFQWLLYWNSKEFEKDPVCALNIQKAILDGLDALQSPCDLALLLDWMGLQLLKSKSKALLEAKRNLQKKR